MQEEIFGGYRFHLDIVDYVWDWNSSSFVLRDIIENLYVTPPSSSTPISAGPVYIRQGYVPELKRNGLIFDMAGINHEYWAQEMPQGPDDFWYKERSVLPPMPHSYFA